MTMMNVKVRDEWGEWTVTVPEGSGIDGIRDALTEEIRGWDTSGNRRYTLWWSGSVTYIDPEVGAPVERRIKVAVDPEEPRCESGRRGHEWVDAGARGHGGGVIVTDRCEHCGLERSRDTWAHDPADGEQGLQSITYRRVEADRA